MSEKKNTHTKPKEHISVEFISLSEQIKTPSFEINDSDTVLNFGEDNDFPQTITELYKTVPMHSAIVDKKSNLIIDGGIVDIDGNELEAPNKFESWDKLMQKIAVDIASYDGCYLKVRWEKGGEKVATYEHIIHDSSRLGLPKDGVIQTVYVNEKFNNPSYEWSAYTNLKASYIKPYLLYNTVAKKNVQVLYIKGYNAITPYGLPDYFSAIKDLNTLAEISTFHNANIHQNMQPGFKFIFEGAVPNDEEKDRIIKETRAKYASAENGGKPLFFFVPEGNKVIAEPMESNDIAKMYSLLQRDVKENILVSHQIPRKIAGIETSGGLGSSKEIMELLELFKHTVIQPKQQLILSFLQPLIGKELMFKKRPTDILLSHDLNDLSSVLTQNELRALLGYDELPKTDVVNDNEDKPTEDKTDE